MNNVYEFDDTEEQSVVRLQSSVNALVTTVTAYVAASRAQRQSSGYGLGYQPFQVSLATALIDDARRHITRCLLRVVNE